MKIRIDESDLKELLKGYIILTEYEECKRSKIIMQEFIKKIELNIEKEKGIR